MTARQSRLFHSLQITAHKLHKHADREIAAQSDLTTAQAAVLSVLAQNDMANQRDIAVALGQNDSAITAMIARLVRSGYIEKLRHPEDRRAWCFRLTETGLAALEATKAPFAQVNALIDGALEPAEIAQLSDVLRRLSDAVDSG